MCFKNLIEISIKVDFGNRTDQVKNTVIFGNVFFQN